MRNVGRYFREPIWAVRAADAKNAAILLQKTAQHHLANWLKAPRDDTSKFTLPLDLGASKNSPVTLRAVGGDISILYEVFAERAYEIPDDVLDPMSVRTVIDCGAHIGLSALYFAYRYPRAQVVAIEPNPSNYRLLVANTSAEPRIKALQACVAAQPGVAKISTDDRAGWGHMVGSEGHEVTALTLEDVRSQFGLGVIDVLKMDIEGMEKAVFAGGVDGVRAMAVELHGSYTVDDFARDVAPLVVDRRRGGDTVFAYTLPDARS
jgi:FkbM family methyltransferase